MLRSALVIIAAFASLGQIADVSPARADTLVTSGGILTGVNGINVGGTSYDVTFAQGTCATVYGACKISNFPFQTALLADDAITALFDDINASPTYQYDPSHIGLCNTGLCLIYLPLSDAAPTLLIDLIEIGLSAEYNGTNLSAVGDTADPDTATLACYPASCYQWSVWTAETTTSAVPEPSAVTLLAAGLLGLGFIGWRRGLNAPS